MARRGERLSTEDQYRSISGNWKRYFSRILHRTGRTELTVDDLLNLLDQQNERCALTNEPLTCILVKGETYRTNASIDRIQPGGAYSLDNIRLVCRIVNTMRWDMSDSELIYWCRKITNGKTTTQLS
jgi:hypothetical protein